MKQFRNDSFLTPAPFGLLLLSLAGGAILFSLSSCSSAQGVTGKVGQKVALQCQGEQAIRIHFNPDDGSLKERGGVQLPASSTCKSLKGASDKKLFSLQREGIWERYYGKGGPLLARGKFHRNKSEGTWEFFDRDGNRIRTAQYSAGLLEGPETSYFPGSDKWRIVGENRKGQKEGVWKERGSPKSDCISEGSYSNGQKEGAWKECAQDPKAKDWYLVFQGSYRRGLRDGKAVHLYPEGTKMATGSYFADIACLKNPPENKEENCSKRTGKWVIRFANGNMAAEGSYDPSTGKRRGTWIEYYQSGQKMAMGSRQHTRQGLWTFFDRRGQILYQFRFEGNDAIPRSGILYENGEKSAEGGFMSGLIKYNAETDSLEAKMLIRSGPWTLYKGGQKVGMGEYQNNRKEGTWKELENGRWVEKKYGMSRKVEDMNRRMDSIFQKMNNR